MLQYLMDAVTSRVRTEDPVNKRNMAHSIASVLQDTMEFTVLGIQVTKRRDTNRDL